MIASSQQESLPCSSQQVDPNTRPPNSSSGRPGEASLSWPSPQVSQQQAHSQSSSLPKDTTSSFHVLSTAPPNPESPDRSIQVTVDGTRDPASCEPANLSIGRDEIAPRDAEDETSPVNAMGSTAYLESRDSSPRNAVNEFYGGSSVAHFMQQLKETIPGTQPLLSHDVQSSPRSLPSKANHFAAVTINGSAFISEDLSLPQRDLADRLLDIYWEKAHTLYPFVHKPSFMRAYQDLWKPSHQIQGGGKKVDLGLGTSGVSDSRTIVFNCALNGIFALSCQLSDTATLHRDRESLSQVFFLRSKALLHVDILDHGSIALVQTLLIIAQFLQSTSFPSRCWTSLGLACRIGQGLGLHVEDRNSQRNPQEVDLCRRVWYGCTIMDIVASTTLGRPLMTLCQITIPLPSASTEEHLLDMDQPISQFTFYLETIKLYLILGKIISTVYKPWSLQGVSNDSESGNKNSHTQYSDSEVVMSLDEELSNFEDNIISYLHWDRGKSIRDSMPRQLQQLIGRQTNVLHARYLHIRVVLYRPTFLRFCRKFGSAQQTTQSLSSNGHNVVGDHRSQKERNLRSKMDLQSSVACISAAVDLVNLLFEATAIASDGAWWYTAFYLTTAAMVVILAESCMKPHQYPYVDVGEAHAAWILCCETLRTLIERGHPVEHALNGLCNIYNKLVPDQCSTEASMNPQCSLQETVPPAEEAQLAVDNEVARGKGNHDFSQGLFPEHTESHRQTSTQPEENLTLPMQPLMDFMMQDMDFMPFGVLDESWWRLQYGNTTKNSGGI